MANREFSKDAYLAKIHQTVQYIMMSQTDLTVLTFKNRASYI
jgi:hypothetical protein